MVRVPYVPQYIRDQIRDEVRIGLKEDVSRDVMAQAKQERWGLPGALPDWITRIKLSGDFRLREESLLYGNGNVQNDYYDVAFINKSGKIIGDANNLFLNTTEDRHRLRSRLRLALKAKVFDPAGNGHAAGQRPIRLTRSATIRRWAITTRSGRPTSIRLI